MLSLKDSYRNFSTSITHHRVRNHSDLTVRTIYNFYEELVKDTIQVESSRIKFRVDLSYGHENKKIQNLTGTR